MGWFRNKRDRPIFHAPCPRRFHLLAAIVMVSARAGMMRLLKMLFRFFFSMKGFSCSAISSSSFPFSLSVPVFSSSVALLRRFPYCSYRWHIRAITPSYRQDKRNAPFRPALRSSDTMPLSGLSRASSRPLVSSGGAFFHHLIGSSRLAVSLSHPFHLVSFHVSDDSGARGVSFLCLVFFVSCRVISSHQMKASKQDGA